MTSLNLLVVSATSAGLTTATTAYTAGDDLGTIWSWSISPATQGLIVGAELHDKADVLGATSLYLFDRSVTLPADNAAPTTAPSDADNLFALGAIYFPPPDDLGANRLAFLDSLGKLVKANASNTIYGMLITLSGHTFFGATTDIVIDLHLSLDV